MIQLENDAVYGPIWTRRFGWDLGINLLPTGHKLCTFDCLYCQYGFTPPLRNEENRFPQYSEIEEKWQNRLHLSATLGIELKHTTVSGNGEPTMHPEFADLAPQLIAWRNQHFPEIRMAILTNGYRLHDRGIREALSSFDEPIFKLDSAIQEKFLQINGPSTKFDLTQYIGLLKQCKRVIIQTMFIHGWNDNVEDLAAWGKALKEIQPVFVQIYTIARPPALIGLPPLSARQLQKIADKATEDLNLPVKAYA